uniref:Uncharacterized protein n=1 Tax=Globodera rostochiensis TaxID=31243 RepID=A0A914IB34_GLORO
MTTHHQNVAFLVFLLIIVLVQQSISDVPFDDSPQSSSDQSSSDGERRRPMQPRAISRSMLACRKLDELTGWVAVKAAINTMENSAKLNQCSTIYEDDDDDGNGIDRLSNPKTNAQRLNRATAFIGHRFRTNCVEDGKCRYVTNSTAKLYTTFSSDKG